MFVTTEKLKKVIREVIGGSEDVTALEKQAKVLKNEIAQLKSDKKIEDAEIKHLVKINKEKLDLEHSKKEVEMQADFQKKQMTLQTEYHDKVLAQIQESREEQRGTYAEIMKRLPNVNVELGGKKR